MRPCLLHPSGCLRGANDAQEPAKQREAIPTAEPEPGRVRPQRIGEGSRIVIGRADRVVNNLRYSLGIFLVIKEVSGDASRPGDRHPLKGCPLTRPDEPVMQPDVRTAGLPPDRQGELMPIRREMPETIQGCRRAMGDDPLLRRSLPRRNLWGELQPGCPKIEVIRWRRPGHAVHALCHPVKDACRGQALQGGP